VDGKAVNSVLLLTNFNINFTSENIVTPILKISEEKYPVAIRLNKQYMMIGVYCELLICDIKRRFGEVTVGSVSQAKKIIVNFEEVRPL